MRNKFLNPVILSPKAALTQELATPGFLTGKFLRKDAPGDMKERDAALETLTKDMGDAIGLMKKFKTDFDAQGAELLSLKKSIGDKATTDGETNAKLTKAAAEVAEAMAKMQACEQAIESIKKNMDSPLYKGGSDLADNDRKAAIQLQRNAFLHKGGVAYEFKADMDNLVDPADYRSAVRKLMEVGKESKARIIRDFSAGERKAFDAASLDTAFFSPEMLGIEVDCEIECAEMLDLYDQISVSRSSFMYPNVTSYGDIGKYDCDAKCDAEYGPEGNIAWRNGSTYDFRGVFCFQRDTLREANYDLLGFMMRSAARSYRINRNQALITGDGVNEPLGWLTADCFSKVATPSQNPTHVDLRQFWHSAPMEYGAVTATMHQNTFAYFVSMVDNNGRFLFGDGLMNIMNSDLRDSIRISNCLPDPTVGGTRGSAAAPFAAGAFIMAAGVWEMAYAAVTHRPMFMEQYEGGSTAWCVKYQFGAKDGGFVKCCPAARTLVAGAA
jgi:hypothetical protein